MGHQELKIERPACDTGKFTFYRVRKAPNGSGIEKGKAENGVIECVFTPEAKVSVLVSTPYLLEPLNIEVSPYATVENVKREAQRCLALEEDPDQILSRGTEILENEQWLRYMMLFHLFLKCLSVVLQCNNVRDALMGRSILK